MDDSLQTTNLGYAVPSVEQRNRVLRNTYWLLALSMVPTVLGAWLGVATGIVASMGVGMSFIVFMVGAFGFIFAIEKTKNSAAGVPMLLGFTFFMGLMLSRLLAFVLGRDGGAALIMTAFAGTGVAFVSMAMLSTLIKRDLSTMGKFLSIGAVMLLVAIVLNLFVQSSALRDDRRADGRHLLGLHRLRPEARPGRARDELHQRDAQHLPGPVQHLPGAAVAPGLRRQQGLGAFAKQTLR